MGRMGLWTVLLMAGCSGATPTVTDGEPVGSVTFKKTPVAQVQVGFHRPGSKERVAFGVTDPQGQFRLFEQDGKPHRLSPDLIWSPQKTSASPPGCCPPNTSIRPRLPQSRGGRGTPGRHPPSLTSIE